MYRFLLVPVLTLISAAAFAAPAKYTIDKDHSKIGFAVRHLMISDVTGSFRDFEGSFMFDADKGELTDATFTAQTASIDTDNTKRDDHLKSADFFDAAKYPTITLTNSKLKKAGKGKYKWSGDLTMHGVTKPVTFDLEHKGTVKDPWGMMRAGFSAKTTIKRSEWGLNWNNALEAGGVAVSDEVRLTLDAEAVQPKADAASAAPAVPAAAAPAIASPAPKKK